MKANCPECGKQMWKITLAGHLKMAHGYSIEKATQALKALETKK